MPIKCIDHPGWYFAVEEVSVGVYKVHGSDESERRVEITGTDPEALLEECKKYAARIISQDKEDEIG